MAPAIKLSRERDNLSSENPKYYLVKVILCFTNLHEMIPFRFLLWGLQLNLCSSPTWSPMSGSLPRPWRSRWLSCWLLPVWTRTILSSIHQDLLQLHSIEKSITLQLRLTEINILFKWCLALFISDFVFCWAIPIFFGANMLMLRQVFVPGCNIVH